MYTLKGEVKVISETRQVSEKFKLREFVITTEGDYPQVIQFQASQDKGDLLDNFKPGDQVEVSFNLRGREWTNPQGEVKVFNTLDAWKIDLLSAPNTTSNDPAF
jgi:ribosomal 30S subunit maturation factor RimM